MSPTKTLTFLSALAMLTSCGGSPAASTCTVTLSATGDAASLGRATWPSQRAFRPAVTE